MEHGTKIPLGFHGMTFDWSLVEGGKANNSAPFPWIIFSWSRSLDRFENKPKIDT
jgi:hypothetical protein